MSLQQYMNKRILIVTVDGRTLTGTLISCDQVTNLVLKETIERVIRPPMTQNLAPRPRMGCT
ncbi:snRNP Sm protein [Taxawa tesnikishii (nom. ined.)]|nr:snRNP Sm protein [Dothideales sp. JES 119]